ncbi:uncharacterized protein LOC142628411 [Castanea sativa]|uniref:uncharacterized protein LOC142628411 n=1 Tax=Castanea sativa TaxID=21020 RepID=UPI003F650EEF
MECEFESAERSGEEATDLEKSTRRANSSGDNRGGNSMQVSFKDKLTGFIPRAYAKAFGFQAELEEGANSNNEMDDLVDGLVTVKMSKSTKVRIRRQWANTLIIKVFGRSVGYHFLYARNMSLWKPHGKMDCVDLEKDYFLIRFEAREDNERVQVGGPWFIGEHFLTIRAWEPNFRPSSANVSTAALWVRLPELPIEYYDKEALTDIGRAIRLVLKVDSNTAREARGRYARICVQVDLEKPLIRSVIIGGEIQQVVYEGVSSLCFSYGRVGHGKLDCKHTVQAPISIPNQSPTKDDEVQRLSLPKEDPYGPWTIVTRKKKNRLKPKRQDVRGPTGGTSAKS